MYSQTYDNNATEAHFLAGGIGTGCFSVGNRGEFDDFELFGEPGKGNYIPYFFFSIYAKPEDQPSTTRVLEARRKKPYTRAHGYDVRQAAGLPRLDNAEMTVQFPFCRVDFSDETLPVNVSLHVKNPFIPLNLEASSYPVALLTYTVSNPGEVPVDVSIAGNMNNVSGLERYEKERWRSIVYADHGKTSFVDNEVLRGFYSESTNLSKEHRHYGNHALLTPETTITTKSKWLNRGNWDGLNEFWQDFSDDGRLEDTEYKAKQLGDERPGDTSSLGIYKTLAPGETAEFPFLYAWYFPQRNGDWYPSDNVATLHYSNYFSNAVDAATKLYNARDFLLGTSQKFAQALYGSTLPAEVIDAASANLTILRSTTCFILKDGTFLSWEGSFDQEGSCEGNCTHVYNYAQTLPFLFPELEQSMARTSFLLETNDEGRMRFRTHQIFGGEPWDYHPAVDGQMGVIIRLYRDWKLTGDDAFLKTVWSKAKKALDFAFTYWDSDGDFFLDSQQHNTYDIEFYGPNSLANSMFLGALEAATRMAEYLGDTAAAEKYAAAFDACSKLFDKHLWNGEYYDQEIEDVNAYVYQYGSGCLSDQILGQTLSHIAGLGYILPEDKVKKAVDSIYKYNFKDMKTHVCTQRTYALNDEKGLVLCSWPKGGRPQVPFIYSDEVWAGVEYAVATHLIYEDRVPEALALVRGVRSRYNGFNRDPFCEVECGNYYVRSMASWGLIPALSGYTFDLVKGEISFAPKINTDNFHCFFSHGAAWGIYHQIRQPDGTFTKEVEVLYGNPDAATLI